MSRATKWATSNVEKLLRSSKAHLDRVGNAGVRRAAWIMDTAPALAITGKLEEAEQLFREAIEIHTQELGSNSLRTSQSIQNLAVCLDHLGELDEAQELYEKSLRIEEQLLGSNHPQHFLTYYNLAVVSQKSGNYRLELQQLERALEIHRLSIGSEHSASLIAYNNLAHVYRNLGRHRDALARTRSNYKILIQNRATDDPSLQGFFAQQAKTQHDLGLLNEAQQSLDQALKLAKGTQFKPKGDSQTIHSGVDVPTAIVAAEFALERGQSNLARDYLLHAQTVNKQLSLKQEMFSERLHHGWSQWYLHEKQFDQAIELLQTSLQSKIRQFHPKSIGLAQAYFMLARGLSLAGRFEKAREANAHAMRIFQFQSSLDSSSTPLSPWLAFVWDIQGDIEHGQGKIAAAISAWKKAEKQFDSKNFDLRHLEKITEKIAQFDSNATPLQKPSLPADL